MAQEQVAASGLKWLFMAVDEFEASAEGFQMTKNLFRRLERLEEQTIPAGERKVIQVVYVGSDGSKKQGPRFELPQLVAKWIPDMGHMGTAGGRQLATDNSSYQTVLGG